MNRCPRCGRLLSPGPLPTGQAERAWEWMVRTGAYPSIAGNGWVVRNRDERLMAPFAPGSQPGVVESLGDPLAAVLAAMGE